jgi:hypothetical protein
MPSKGNTTSREYGSKHQKLRRDYEPLIASGNATCWRCGQPITPGTKWDLGHDDTAHNPDGTRKHNGPEHALKRDCPAGGNRATKGRRPPMPATDTSRQW